jgi:hypothetical protein
MAPPPTPRGGGARFSPSGEGVTLPLALEFLAVRDLAQL